MDFGMFAPEINSGLIYSGPGSGPLFAVAAAWDELAAGLHSTAASYSSVISGLTVGWQGPSSAAMATAVAPFVAWMSGTAVQAEQAATQAKVAAAAYETAFAATVPPPAIAANRSLLMSLIATNLLGQNSAAIAATQAQYAEMWAQDAGAMYAYAGSSATATRMTPFSPPPQITDLAGTAGQASAVAQAAGTHAQVLPGLMSALPQTLQTLAAPASAAAADPPSSQSLLDLLAFGFGPFNVMHIYSPLGSGYDLGVQSFLAPFNNYNMQVAYAGAVGRLGYASAGVSAVTRPVGLGSEAVSASVGRAGWVGSLSVPPSWAGAAPAMRPVAFVLPQSDLTALSAAVATDGEGSVFSNMALSGLAGRAVVAPGGAVAHTAGTGIAAGASATTATIIVIPED